MNHHFESFNFTGLAAGPRLIVTGAVHGNETCGTVAIQRVLRELADGRLRIAAGSVTFVPVCNPLAFARGERIGERNLNRNLYPKAEPVDFEDRVANWLCPLLAAHDVLLDLHSFHTAGQPFAMLGPRDNAGRLEPFAHCREEEALARALGVTRFVEGWLDTYARGVERRLAGLAPEARQTAALTTDVRYGVGTTEYMRSVGGYGLTLECGQHADPAAPEVAYRAIRNALAHLGLVEAERPPALAGEVLRLYEVVDLEQAGDRLACDWSSFDRLKAGDLIGTRADGREVRAEADGYIVFPNPRALPGQEWFYLARASDRLQ